MIRAFAQTNLENFIQSAFQVADLSITLNPYQGLKRLKHSQIIRECDRVYLSQSAIAVGV